MNWPSVSFDDRQCSSAQHKPHAHGARDNHNGSAEMTDRATGDEWMAGSG